MSWQDPQFILGKTYDWVAKSRNDTDPYDKYVSIFIAFNIFYNLNAKTRKPLINLRFGDSERALKVRRLLDATTVLMHLGHSLDSYVDFVPVSSEEYVDGRIPITDTLRQAYRRGDAEQAMEFLFRWLYRVRCNLFHGNKDFNVERQREMLRRSSVILDIILDELVSKYCEQWGVTLPPDLQQNFHFNRRDAEPNEP
jgi:hypothetical protein